MMDHLSQTHFCGILLTLLCFYRQMPGTCATNILRLNPPSIVVPFGGPASVNCSTSETNSNMGWEASQGAVDMMDDVQLITWMVERLEHYDISPLCYINTQNKNQYRQRLNITVYKLPDQVSISAGNHLGPMIETREYELRCDVQNVAPVGLLTVNWYKGQHQVKSEGFSEESKFPHSKTSTLPISPSRDDDGVQYRCEAELNLGQAGPQSPLIVRSDPLDITVHFGPEFSNCPPDIRLKEGDSLDRFCKVTGNPFPQSHWEWKGHTIDPATPLNRTSRGQYNIIINGTIARSLTVELMYGPEISCGLNYTVKNGEYFTPNCIVEGFPPYEITWYKDEDEVDFPVLMYKTDAGQYTLQASNMNSVVNHTLEIEVVYPPSEISELQNAQVSKGEDVVLKCSSNAKPRPRYKWIYHKTSNVYIKDQDGVSLLHINQAGGDNIGTYTCTAYNDLGETNQVVRVDVRGANATCPLFITSQRVVLEYGKSVNVECRSSESSASLSWTFLNSVLNESTLLINSSFVSNWKGKASCHGHFVGLDDCQKDVDITVYRRPDQVSIHTQHQAQPMIEGKNYTLYCEIDKNVAPLHLLTVNWYKGQDLVKNESYLGGRDPMKLMISPSRNDAQTQYSCETELKLGPEISPKVKSNPLSVTVHYKPAITEKLAQRVPVFHGYPLVLVCEASGYPEPTIAWVFSNERFEGRNLTVKEISAEYTCIASNSVGIDTRVVTVILTEDYLPLIAGFVALVVLFISLIFISIYFIYYKNTKMGHYTVEGAKPNAQNGNIAQNGKDSTIPMKKIMV